MDGGREGPRRRRPPTPTAAVLALSGPGLPLRAQVEGPFRDRMRRDRGPAGASTRWACSGRFAPQGPTRCYLLPRCLPFACCWLREANGAGVCPDAAREAATALEPKVAAKIEDLPAPSSAVAPAAELFPASRAPWWAVPPPASEQQRYVPASSFRSCRPPSSGGARTCSSVPWGSQRAARPAGTCAAAEVFRPPRSRIPRRRGTRTVWPAQRKSCLEQAGRSTHMLKRGLRGGGRSERRRSARAAPPARRKRRASSRRSGSVPPSGLARGPRSSRSAGAGRRGGRPVRAGSPGVAVGGGSRLRPREARGPREPLSQDPVLLPEVQPLPGGN